MKNLKSIALALYSSFSVATTTAQTKKIDASKVQSGW
jgi:hypothetical protein